MRLLARREHAERELRSKLVTRGFDVSEIDECLSQLKNRGWQSDQRYASAVINSRSQRGQGPRKIAMVLNQHQVSTEGLSTSDIDWIKNAVDVLAKYCRNKDVSDFNTRMKAMRHVVQKGFSPEQAQMAMAKFKQIDND